MAVKANGTHAKEVAIHFLNLTTDGRYTPSVVARTIGTAKSILNSGYSKEEIIEAMEYLHNVKKVNMYSIGYVSSAITDILREINQLKAIDASRENNKLMKDIPVTREEAVHDQESALRNIQKAERNRVQSRIGKKFNFDMLEE